MMLRIILNINEKPLCYCFFYPYQWRHASEGKRIFRKF
nr:MAG TPA: hypothetical protein [Caudoviricetes sp.]